MIYSIVFLAASAATVAAQAVSYNSTTGTYTCNMNPNGAYCASDSLDSPIIIRCTNGVGQPGNCNDNTAGYYPYGDLGNSLCWETSDTSGDAACEKNCIVEGATGNYDGTFTLPGCTPAVPSTTASVVASSTIVSSVAPTTTTTAASSSTTITSTGTTTYTNGGVTTTEIFTFTTVVCPATSTTIIPVVTLSTSAIMPLSTVAYSSPAGPVVSSIMSNGTVVATSVASGSATATPVGPTTSAPLTIATGSARANSAGAGLAAIGLFIAYFM